MESVSIGSLESLVVSILNDIPRPEHPQYILAEAVTVVLGKVECQLPYSLRILDISKDIDYVDLNLVSVFKSVFDSIEIVSEGNAPILFKDHLAQHSDQLKEEIPVLVGNLFAFVEARVAIKH